jgi:hypothetical protein
VQTVASLIRELQKFPPNARCYAYEGEPITRADGTTCHSYVVVVGPERVTYDGGGRGYPQLGIVPCAEGDQEDGPAIR